MKHYPNQKILLRRCPRKLWGKLLPLDVSPTGYKRGSIYYSHSATFSQRVHISFRGAGKEGKRWVMNVDIDNTSQRAFTDLLSSFFKCLFVCTHTVDASKW